MSTRPVWILLHGALGTGEVLADLGMLLQENSDVLIPDLPGHGSRSDDHTEHTIESYTRFLQDFIEGNSLQDIHVFGHSLGGYVALNHARVYPGRISRVITFGTKFHWSAEVAEQLVKMLNPEKIEMKVPVFAQLLKDRHGDPFWKNTVLGCAHAMTQLGSQPLLFAQSVREIDIPVFCTVGSEDDVVSAEETRQMASSLQLGRALILQGLPHQIEKVDPQELLKLF